MPKFQRVCQKVEQVCQNFKGYAKLNKKKDEKPVKTNNDVNVSNWLNHLSDSIILIILKEW